MRKVVSILVLCLLVLNCIYSQEYVQPDVKPNYNAIDPSLDKYVGKWQYVNGSQVFFIEVTKINYLVDSLTNSRLDALYGKHFYKVGDTYIENGFVKEDTIGYFNKNYSFFLRSIAINKVNGLIINFSSKKLESNDPWLFDMEAEISNDNNSLRVIIKPMEGVYGEEDGDPIPTIPADIILKRVID